MMPMLCLVIDPRYRATGYGILNFFSTLIGGIGVYAGGLLRDSDINLSTMFKSASIIMILCALLLFLARPKSDIKNNTLFTIQLFFTLTEIRCYQ